MKKKIILALAVAFLFGSISIATAPAPISAPATSVSIIPQASAQSTAAEVQPSKPARIIIPVASVDTDVIPVGVTATNNLDVPPNFVEAGWYKYGPMPGQHGTAVLDGHVDNGGSTPGPFKHLRDVKVGDDIQIVGENGATLHFKVKEVDVYQTDQFPSGQIFNDDSGSLIKIITCHGTFVKSRDTYDQRLVVTAELAS